MVINGKSAMLEDGEPDDATFNTLMEKLLHYMKFYASKSELKFLTNSVARHLLDLDIRCQDDPMMCAVHPLCEKRRWLTILIKSGAPFEKIPQFCYRQQVNIFKSFINHEKYFYEPVDCAMYLDDFYTVVMGKSSYNFSQMMDNDEYEEITWQIVLHLKSRFNRVLHYDLGESVIIITDETVWLFDYIGNYVLLNVMDEYIYSQESLYSIIKLFNRYYKLDTRVLKKTSDEWILDMVLFEIHSAEISQNQTLKDFLADEISTMAREIRAVNFKIEDNKAHLLVKINAYCGMPWGLYTFEPVTIGDIKKVFKYLSAFKQKFKELVLDKL
ncbi:MAG: hypothetical protein ACTSWN_02375 [Promethearchaeota archaeon]